MRNRRDFLRGISGLGISLALGSANAASRTAIQRAIPSSGELLPVIGLGTWISFDIGDDIDARPQRLKVLQAFFEHGGGMIDSSPMYGSAEYVLGGLRKNIPAARKLFAASKVWTLGKQRGVEQMEASRKFWGVPRFDLMQVHNLLDWEAHLETLSAWKREGRIRYLGVTTSHGRRHDEMERIMRKVPLDFVQFTYNLADREAEQRLLPLARERRIAVIANRPFQHGDLFSRVKGKPLPTWAREFDCDNWAQFFLKFVVAHPAVTCAIPATRQPAHLVENMGAGVGRLPDAKTRQRMIQYFESI